MSDSETLTDEPSAQQTNFGTTSTDPAPQEPLPTEEEEEQLRPQDKLIPAAEDGDEVDQETIDNAPMEVTDPAAAMTGWGITKVKEARIGGSGTAVVAEDEEEAEGRKKPGGQEGEDEEEEEEAAPEVLQQQELPEGAVWLGPGIWAYQYPPAYVAPSQQFFPEYEVTMGVVEGIDLVENENGDLVPPKDLEPPEPEIADDEEQRAEGYEGEEPEEQPEPVVIAQPSDGSEYPPQPPRSETETTEDQPEAAAPSQSAAPDLPDISGMTVADVRSYVEGNPERAQDVYDVENTGKGRATLLDWLEGQYACAPS